MDPNATLKDALELAENIQSDAAMIESTGCGELDLDECTGLADRIKELHLWIRKGGFLPDAWEECQPKQDAEALAKALLDCIKEQQR